ncbi:hypothetical protein KSS87_000846 [Heliosperma pusillum]|nr:hypothetical protein KSS87_020812 [Heliosperma pusillum]KAH9624476.1 hypothetical protein KSS87_000846 [Heliosperma pusillum]
MLTRKMIIHRMYYLILNLNLSICVFFLSILNVIYDVFELYCNFFEFNVQMS